MMYYALLKMKRDRFTTASFFTRVTIEGCFGAMKSVTGWKEELFTFCLAIAGNPLLRQQTGKKG